MPASPSSRFRRVRNALHSKPARWIAKAGILAAGTALTALATHASVQHFQSTRVPVHTIKEIAKKADEKAQGGYRFWGGETIEGKIEGLEKYRGNIFGKVSLKKGKISYYNSNHRRWESFSLEKYLPTYEHALSLLPGDFYLFAEQHLNSAVFERANKFWNGEFDPELFVMEKYYLVNGTPEREVWTKVRENLLSSYLRESVSPTPSFLESLSAYDKRDFINWLSRIPSSVVTEVRSVIDAQKRQDRAARHNASNSAAIIAFLLGAVAWGMLSRRGKNKIPTN